MRVFVDGRQVASIPRGLQGEYREVVESLNREGVAATIHVELESDAYVDVWGLCKPERRPEGEPLLPTQYREDIDLLDGIASALDELASTQVVYGSSCSVLTGSSVLGVVIGRTREAPVLGVAFETGDVLLVR